MALQADPDLRISASSQAKRQGGTSECWRTCYNFAPGSASLVCHLVCQCSRTVTASFPLLCILTVVACERLATCGTDNKHQKHQQPQRPRPTPMIQHACTASLASIATMCRCLLIHRRCTGVGRLTVSSIACNLLGDLSQTACDPLTSRCTLSQFYILLRCVLFTGALNKLPA